MRAHGTCAPCAASDPAVCRVCAAGSTRAAPYGFSTQFLPNTVLERQRSCPVEERGQRGALGPRCSRRPAKAVRLGAGAAATTHGLSTRVAGSRVPGPRKKGPWALICKSSDGRQARGQRPSVRSQGRGTALGNRALTDGLYGPGQASPVDRHPSLPPPLPAPLPPNLAPPASTQTPRTPFAPPPTLVWTASSPCQARYKTIRRVQLIMKG